MAAVTLKPRRPRPPARRRAAVAAGAAAVAVAAVVGATAGPATLDLPSHVRSVAVDNPHPWLVAVEVTAPGEGRHLLGRVPRETSRSFSEVVDQGRTWVFRFDYAGVTEEVRADRDTLAAEGWVVRVPEALATRLAAGDVPESPGGGEAAG